MDQVARVAVDRVQQAGIIFLDEIDKIAGRESGGHGPDVSREGVQRDILPIVEGTTVNTKHGMVRTDHILFVAAGAFHVSKPSRPRFRSCRAASRSASSSSRSDEPSSCVSLPNRAARSSSSTSR